MLPWKNKRHYIFSVCVCSFSYPAYKTYTLYFFVICGLTGSTIFFHIISSTARFSEKKSINLNNCFDILHNFVLNIYYSKKIQRNIIIHTHRSSCKVTANLARCWWNSNSFDRFLEKKALKYQNSWKSLQWKPSNSMCTDGQKGRHDEANSRFFPNFTNALKNST